jgi:hypothetical protein
VGYWLKLHPKGETCLLDFAINPAYIHLILYRINVITQYPVDKTLTARPGATCPEYGVFVVKFRKLKS